jgi:hypothetical protein
MNFSSQESLTTSTSVTSPETFHSTLDEIQEENNFNTITQTWSLQEKYEREQWKNIDDLEELMTVVMSLAEKICKIVTTIKSNLKNN